jgi:hypothetical protein
VTEKLADTPCSISRIWRATARTRRIVVSAEKSYDVNKKPLEYRWVLLRGDAKHVTIKPLNDDKSKVEITLDWFERAPIAPGAELESNRVDVGAFVSNGTYWSAPAFVTFMTIDSEARTYDDKGRLSEIGYGVGGTQVRVSNWAKLFDELTAEKPPAGVAMLKSSLKPEDIEAMLKIAPAYKEKSASKDPKVAQEGRDLIEKPQPGLKTPAKRLVDAALQRLASDPKFLSGQQLAIRAAVAGDAAVAAKYEKARGRLVRAGLPTDAEVGGRALSAYEVSEVRRLNGDVLSQVLLPGLVTSTDVVNYVDPNLARPKQWRDIYHYAADGTVSGWTRTGLDKIYEFTPDGKVILERGADGAATRTAKVRYEQIATSDPRRGPNWNPLKQVVEGN